MQRTTYNIQHAHAHAHAHACMHHVQHLYAHFQHGVLDDATARDTENISR